MIERLRKKFKHLNDKYQSKKELFKKKVEKWCLKGLDEPCRNAKNLLEQADHLVQELQHEFSAATADAVAIKAKVKRFGKIYKELNESTKPLVQQWFEAIVVALVLAFILRHTIFSPYHVPTGSAEPNILVGDRIWGNKMAYYLHPVQRGELVIFDDPRHVYDRSSTIQYLWQRFIGLPVPMLGLSAGPINVVKRVIAIPGDTIEGRIEDGKTTIYLNGAKLDEPYVNPYPLIAMRKEKGFINFDNIGPFMVPSFLRKHWTKELRYTYVPTKPYNAQPFYDIEEANIIRDSHTGKPVLYQPYSPIYDIKVGYKEFFSRDTFGPFTLPKDMYWVMGDSRKNSEDSRYWGPLHKKYIRGRASFVLFSLDSEEDFWLFDLLKHPMNFWTKHVRWNRTLKMLKNDVVAQAKE
ncbi:signal peptidase I [Candidatus Babeliales bacterium]|nr:signal peptidase I [Candidatus Babeliales bacterium]